MVRFLKYRWVLLLHVIIMVVASLLYPYLDKAHYGVYFKLVAFAWCIPPYYLLFCFYNTKALDILIVFSFFASNNLLDELFFDPTKLQVNEIIFAVVTIITVFMLPCQTKSKKSGNN
jgi:hypothetical protein